MNSLNSRTLTKKVWENVQTRIIPPLEGGGNSITSPVEITDTYANHCANISKDPNKKKKSGKHRKRKNEEDLPYNKLFTDKELKTAIKQQKNTTPREDTITSPNDKKLPPKRLKYLLDMYNRIWKEGEIPKTWKHTTMTSLLKERKDTKDVKNENQ